MEFGGWSLPPWPKSLIVIDFLAQLAAFFTRQVDTGAQRSEKMVRSQKTPLPKEKVRISLHPHEARDRTKVFINPFASRACCRTPRGSNRSSRVWMRNFRRGRFSPWVHLEDRGGVAGRDPAFHGAAPEHSTMSSEGSATSGVGFEPASACSQCVLRGVRSLSRSSKRTLALRFFRESTTSSTRSAGIAGTTYCVLCVLIDK